MKLHCEITGSGPALLLTHGFTGSSADFAKNVDALARTHTVITWDLRGHGRSEAPADPAAYSVPLSIGDMAALLDRAGAERAVLAGHSLGGFLSLEFHLAQRARVAGLILIDTGPAIAAKRRAPTGTNAPSASHATSKPRATSAHSAWRTPRAASSRSTTDACSSPLPGIALPTLVVVGEHDTPFLGGSRYMAEQDPGREARSDPDAGHSPQAEQPEAFDRAVSRFLHSVDPA